MTGLEPRDFTWVIDKKLAVSERIGGYGFQHRRVRREEEIIWLKAAGVNAVLSLLDGNQNISAYEMAGFRTYHVPLAEVDTEAVGDVFATLNEALSERGAMLLVHRDIIDDTVAGLLGGYLVHSGMVSNPIVATAMIQEILKRPLGPEARALIPDEASP